MKRIPKNKKYTGKDLATLQLEDMLFQAEQLLTEGTKPEDLQHKYNLQAFEEVCTTTFERDPGHRVEYDAYCSIAAWAANNYLRFISDRGKITDSIEARYFLILQALESGFASGVDPEDLLKKTEEAVLEYGFYCCYSYMLNDALRVVADHYIWHDLRHLIIPENDMQKQTANLQNHAADLRERKPLKEIEPIIEKFCALLDELEKEAKKPDTAAGQDRALDVLVKWGDNPAKFNGEDIEEAMLVDRLHSVTVTPASTIRHAPLKQITYFRLTNDNATNAMIAEDGIAGMAADGQITLKWDVPQSGKAPIVSYHSLLYGGNVPDTVKKKHRLDARDEAIINALGSIGRAYGLRGFDAGDPVYFTDRELWLFMTRGNSRDRHAKMSGAQRKDLQARMDKLRTIIYEADIEEEVKHGMLEIDGEKVTRTKIRDNLLLLREREAETDNGSIISVYEMTTLPPTFAYSDAKNHLITVNAKLLDVGISITENVIEFRDYLLKEIYRMRRGQRVTRMMLDTVYEKTGVLLPAARVDRGKYKTDKAYQRQIKEEARKDREKIENILRSWEYKPKKDKDCILLHSFQQVKQGSSGAVIGYDIFIQNPAKGKK